MTAANIAVYAALIIYLLARKMIGQPLREGRKLLVLPVLVTIIGYGDLGHGGTLKATEIGLIVLGSAISLVLGAWRGAADRLSERDGARYVQWTWFCLGLFASNLVIKLILDVVGLEAGSTGSQVGRSLVFTLGLTMLGEAVILWLRSGGAAALGQARLR